MTDNNMNWYKWWPQKCLSSIKWLSLSLEEEGLYRRLYDFASLSQPSDKRGWLYTDGVPTSQSDLRVASRLHASKFRVNFQSLLKKKLLTQDENGAYGFPNFAKHQRNSNLRPRVQNKRGTKVEQNKDEIGLQNKEAELISKNTEEEEEKQSIPALASNFCKFTQCTQNYNPVFKAINAKLLQGFSIESINEVITKHENSGKDYWDILKDCKKPIAEKDKFKNVGVSFNPGEK